jgi:hypothetical protein
MLHCYPMPSWIPRSSLVASQLLPRVPCDLQPLPPKGEFPRRDLRNRGSKGGAYSIIWRVTASTTPAAIAHKRSPPLGCTGPSRWRHHPGSNAGWAPSSLSVLNLWVPRLRLVQPWSSAGIHGCKLRSRGTHIIKVDGLPGDHAEPERRRRILRCEIRLPGRCTPFQPQRGEEKQFQVSGSKFQVNGRCRSGSRPARPAPRPWFPGGAWTSDKPECPAAPASGSNSAPVPPSFCLPVPGSPFPVPAFPLPSGCRFPVPRSPFPPFTPSRMVVPRAFQRL